MLALAKLPLVFHHRVELNLVRWNGVDEGEVGEWEARGDLSDPLACEKKVPARVAPIKNAFQRLGCIELCLADLVYRVDGVQVGWGIENQVRAKIFGDVADDVFDTDVVAALVFFVEWGRVDSVVQ